MSNPINKSYLLTQLKNFKSTILDAIFEQKIDEPQIAGTEGQVLTIDSNGNKVWDDVHTLPYTFTINNDGDLLCWYPDTATQQEIADKVWIDNNGNLIMVI